MFGLASLALSYFMNEDAKKQQEKLLKAQKEAQEKADRMRKEAELKRKAEEKFQRDLATEKANLEKAVAQSDESANMSDVTTYGGIAEKNLKKTSNAIRKFRI